MKYAVIRTGGKQYRISEGDVITVERLSSEKDNPVTFSDVLLYTADGTTQIGQPLVKGVTVQGKVVDNVRGEKIHVRKFKAKVRYRKVTGHRQALSKVLIEKIETGKSAKKADEAAK